ncbi:MAG: TIGR00725 family protein [Mycobacteriales bacterium]
MPRAVQIAVIGPSAATEAELAAAREVGAALAAAGAVVLCGGMGGVMAAAAGGASEAGGLPVGILPGEDRAGAAPGLGVAVLTGVGEARNVILVRSADAVIAVGCSWGTLSEIAIAMGRGTPVVMIGGWTLRDQEGRQVAGPRPAAGAAEAVQIALDLARGAGE